ncbi:unnamed protein product [Caretta caretta]
MLARIGPQFRIFTVLDIANGFWSLPLATSCQYKTAFTWEGRQFCWTVLPQGYRDSPAIFHRYMRQALEGVDSARCTQYVDDLLLMSGTEEEDRELTEQVLQALARAGLKVNGKKAQMGQTRVTYLGVEVSQMGREIDKGRVQLIQSLPLPTDVKSLQSFLGLTGFCRDFVANYAEIAQPLFDLTRASTWEWSEECTEAVRVLKENLASAPVLASPDGEKFFYLYPLVSDTTIGCALTREYGAKDRPVAFASRLLSAVELKYGWCEKVLLCSYWGVGKFKYLTGMQKVIIRSHHDPLRLLNMHTILQGQVSGQRIAKWLLALQAENIKAEVLKEPIVWVAGLHLAGTPHQCEASPGKTQHQVFRAANPNQVKEGTLVWFLDGSCSYQGGRKTAGLAVVGIRGNETVSTIGFSLEAKSAQEAELAALLTALNEVDPKFEAECWVVVDSDYVFRGATLMLRWWADNHFRATDGSTIKHATWWKRVEELSHCFTRINVVKVKAHKKTGPLSKGNNLADVEAKRAATEAPPWPWEPEESVPVAVLTRSGVDTDRGGQIRELQESDPGLEGIMKLGDRHVPKVELMEGIWCVLTTEGPVMLCPQGSRTAFLSWVHGSLAGGHPGFEEALGTLKRLCWWPGMAADLKSHLERCLDCARHSPPHKVLRGELMRQAPRGPWERIQIDYTGPLPPDHRKNRFMLVVVDAFSRWVEAFPTKYQTARVTAAILVNEVFTRWGVPKVIDSDQGAAFRSDLLGELSALTGITQLFHIAYHPQAAGQVGRMNRTIKSELRKGVEIGGKNRSQLLPFVLMRLRARESKGTVFSPYEALMGRPMERWENLLTPVPGEVTTHGLTQEWILTLIEHVKQVQQAVAWRDEQGAARVRAWYDLPGERNLPTVGDLVMYKIPGQHHPFPAPKWKGPYLVLDQLGPSLLLLGTENGGREWVHCTQIKRYKQGIGKGDM